MNTRTQQGFALIFVMIIITIFGGSAYSILTRFDNEARNAVRNMENVTAYYWQDGRLRLLRYKFSHEISRNGPNWDSASQMQTLQRLVEEVFPATTDFDWRASLSQDNGGYVSKGTYVP